MSPHINVIQLTDTHLFDRKGEKLLGLDTDHCLDKMLEHIVTHEKPDFILATGDLTHNASLIAYERFKHYLSRIGVPVYCLPGNHDESKLLSDTLNDGLIQTTDRMTSSNGWQILFLDTSIPDCESGHLKEEELEIVEKQLTAEKSRPTLICLHHPAISIDSQWLDTMMIDNGDEIIKIAENQPQVRAIICGHIHQDFEVHHKHFCLLGTPSTCVQFLPRSEEFSVDAVPPGYRRFKLFNNGDLETDVVRLNEIPGKIAMNEGGY